MCRIDARLHRCCFFLQALLQAQAQLQVQAAALAEVFMGSQCHPSAAGEGYVHVIVNEKGVQFGMYRVLWEEMDLRGWFNSLRHRSACVNVPLNSLLNVGRASCAKFYLAQARAHAAASATGGHSAQFSETAKQLIASQVRLARAYLQMRL